MKGFNIFESIKNWYLLLSVLVFIVGVIYSIIWVIRLITWIIKTF